MNDQFTVRAVVIFLGVFALAALGGTTWLIHDNVPAASIAVISGAMGVALGGLGTLLASVKVGDGTPAALAVPPMAIPMPPAPTVRLGDAAP